MNEFTVGTETISRDSEKPALAHDGIDPDCTDRTVRSINSYCVVCGADNSTGMHIEFMATAEGVSAEWTPADTWQSFKGVIHGGILSTVLDEAMSKAIIERGWEALTAELRVRFKGRISPGQPLKIRAWVVQRNKRRIEAEATLTGGAGEERAHAWATFLVPTRPEVALPSSSLLPVPD